MLHLVRRSMIPLLALMAAAAQAAGPAAAPAAPAATTAPGAFNWGQRYFFPQGCLRNGSTAICSFQMVNQGPQATVTAWNGNGPHATGELKGLQFIDNGNVPHLLANAYFRNRFGDTVPTMVVQTKDQVTWVAEFNDVNPAVTRGFFVLGNQTLANIAVTNPAPVQMAAPTGVPIPNAGGAPATVAAPAGPDAVAPPQAAAPAQPAPAQAANGSLPAECQNPATMNTAACRTAGKLQRTNDKVNAAGAAVQTTATTVNSLAETARGLKSLFGKSEPAPQAVQQAPVQQAPVQQAPAPQAPAPQPAAPR